MVNTQGNQNLLKAPTSNNQNAKSKLSVRTIDFMGGSFNLSYSTSTGKHQTLIGGYVTILLGLVVLSSSLLIFSQYFNTEAPIVTTSTEFHSKFTEFNLYEEELFEPLAVVVGGALIPAVGIARYITPQIQMQQYSFNNQTRNYELKTLLTFNYVPCDTINDPKVLEVIEKVNSVSSELQGNSLCPDFRDSPNEFRAMRNLSNSTYYVPKLMIFPCSLPDQSLCASKQEIFYSNVVYANVEKLMVSSNLKNPIGLFPRTKSMSLDSSLAKAINYDLSFNQVFDDTNIFSGPTLKEEFVTQQKVDSDSKKRNELQLHCSAAQIAMGVFGGCVEYIGIEYYPTGQLAKIRRNYRKMTTVLGELGGFVKLISTVVFVLYSFYNARSVKNHIANHIYNFGNRAKKQEGKPAKRYREQQDSSMVPQMAIEGSNNSNKLDSKEKSVMSVKKEKKDLVDQNKYGDVIKECVKSRTSAMDMINKMDFVEMLQELMFEENDKVLLPLLVLKLKEKQMKKIAAEEKAKRQKEEQKFNNNKNQLFSKKRVFASDFQPEEQVGTQGKAPLGPMEYEEAYNRLLASNPDTKMKQSIRQLMIENVGEFFQESKQGIPSSNHNDEETPESAKIAKNDQNDFQLEFSEMGDNQINHINPHQPGSPNSEVVSLSSNLMRSARLANSRKKILSGKKNRRGSKLGFAKRSFKVKKRKNKGFSSARSKSKKADFSGEMEGDSEVSKGRFESIVGSDDGEEDQVYVVNKLSKFAK